LLVSKIERILTFIVEAMAHDKSARGDLDRVLEVAIVNFSRPGFEDYLDMIGLAPFRAHCP